MAMSAETARHLRLGFQALTTLLVALCLFVLNSLSNKVGNVDDRQRVHLEDKEIHETLLQKTSARRDTAREVMKEWDNDVVKPRWAALNERLDRMEGKK